ncbi:MAG: hypothetical protein IT200_05685 [Thermoleophilia bacterium]|nr:hypothetical protein [Thermoleophilia bacterium]
MTEISELRRLNAVHWVRLPEGAEAPFAVYVNGAPRREGDEFVVDGDRIRFDPPLHARPRMGFGRSVMLALGIGVYGDLRGDTLDITFHRHGRMESRAEIKLVPTPPVDAPS